MKVKLKYNHKTRRRRDTRQREAIRKVFCRIQRPVSVSEVLEHAKKDVPGLNQATVYRTLKMLSDDGWITEISHGEAGVLYEQSGKEHHHHFYCRDCNRLYELAGCALPEGVRAPAGFVIEGHEVFVRGLCQKCSGRSVHKT